jgi:hypothetical protein
MESIAKVSPADLEKFAAAALSRLACERFGLSKTIASHMQALLFESSSGDVSNAEVAQEMDAINQLDQVCPALQMSYLKPVPLPWWQVHLSELDKMN